MRGAKRWQTPTRLTVNGPRHYFEKRPTVMRSGFVWILWSNGGPRSRAGPSR